MTLGQLDSATKYPHMLNYHDLMGNERTGYLNLTVRDDITKYCEENPETILTLSEKLNGTNSRVLISPIGEIFYGSRDKVISDANVNSNITFKAIRDRLLPMTDQLIDWCDRIKPQEDNARVFFFEVFGNGIADDGGAYKESLHGNQHTMGTPHVAHLFDIADIPAEVLEWPRDHIAGWRNRGGQLFWPEELTCRLDICSYSPYRHGRLARIKCKDLPTTLEDTLAYMESVFAAVDPKWIYGNPPEGLVARSENRDMIFKLRFPEYRRTIKAMKEEGYHGVA